MRRGVKRILWLGTEAKGGYRLRCSRTMDESVKRVPISGLLHAPHPRQQPSAGKFGYACNLYARDKLLYFIFWRHPRLWQPILAFAVPSRLPPRPRRRPKPAVLSAYAFEGRIIVIRPSSAISALTPLLIRAGARSQPPAPSAIAVFRLDSAPPRFRRKQRRRSPRPPIRVLTPRRAVFASSPVQITRSLVKRDISSA